MRPKLLLVSLGVTYGGAETYYVKLAKVLLAQYDLLGVVCSMRLFEEFRDLGIEVRYVGNHARGGKRYVEALKLCDQLIRSSRTRLVHLNGQPENYLAPIFRLRGLRVLTTRHTPFTNLFLLEGSKIPILIKRTMVLLCLRCCCTIFCVSKLLQLQLRAYLPDANLPLIPTWVEDDMLEVYTRPVQSSPLRVLFVGRVVHNKGIFDVIECIRRVEGVGLFVVGDGPELEEAKCRAAHLPIEFLGFAPNCSAAYRSADLLVFASPEGFEGLPQVPLEAMAMGVPCLASNISSIRELAETDPDGPPVLALYMQGDLDDMVQQMKRLLDDPGVLGRIGAAGRDHVARKFTVQAVAGPYLREFAAVGGET